MANRAAVEAVTRGPGPKVVEAALGDHLRRTDGPLARVGALTGALLVAAAVVGVPGEVRASVRAAARADVACRDNPGFWCLYGKPGLQDGGGLFATNNPDTDLKMDGDRSWFNDRTRSVINRSGSYLGLYDDIAFKSLMVCLPPNTSVGDLRPGVSSLRVHPSRGAACTDPAAAREPVNRPSKPPTRAPERPSAETGGGRASAPPSVRPPRDGVRVSEPPPKVVLPSVSAPAPRLAGPPPVNVAATGAATERDGGVSWGAVAAIVGAGVTLLLLAGLGIGGWLVRRGRRAAVPMPRTATDPDAASRAHRALLLLVIDCEQDKRDLPKVRAVTIDDTEVSLHLAADDVRVPHLWRVASGGRRWCLSVADIDELTDDVDPAAPYPLLAQVRPGMWVNLAALPGPVALTGSRKAAREAAVGLARSLRENPWHEGVRVRMVGFPSEASTESETGTERGRVVFINDGMQVPAKIPPGSAVVTVGRPDGPATTLRVRFDGSLVPPADVFAKDSAPGPAKRGSAPAPGGGGSAPAPGSAGSAPASDGVAPARRG